MKGTLACVAVLLVAGCGGQAATTSRPTPEGSAAEEPARIDLPVMPGDDVEGLVTVGGHDLYARCAGKGSPTVVYFHGWAQDPGYQPVDVMRDNVEPLLEGQVRLCTYERRNVGRSDQVDGSQTVIDTLGDAEGLLDAMGEKGPFVLLGASYGGHLTNIFAEDNTDRVLGAVLIDSSLPVDATIDRENGFFGLCNENNRSLDATSSIEKTDNCMLARYGEKHAGAVPKVPMTFLASTLGSRGDADGDPHYKAWLRRHWGPVTWTYVEAPHWMEHDAPKLVARTVLAMADRVR